MFNFLFHKINAENMFVKDKHESLLQSDSVFGNGSLLGLFRVLFAFRESDFYDG